MFDLKTDANSKEIVTSCHYKSEIDPILQRNHAPSLAKLQLSGQVLKWTPFIGQRGSDLKVESDIVFMLPVRAV